jgi:hypothetical protein
MAFIVEDGTGLQDANAYISLNEFNSYWDDRGFDHSGSTDLQKQVAIIKSTDYIELRYRSRFKGCVEFEDQFLSFPREGLYNSNGTKITGIPALLKHSIAEYSKRALSNDLITDPVTDSSGLRVKKKREAVGPIETEIEFSDSYGVQSFQSYPAADSLIYGYLNSSQGRVTRS